MKKIIKTIIITLFTCFTQTPINCIINEINNKNNFIFLDNTKTKKWIFKKYKSVKNYEKQKTLKIIKRDLPISISKSPIHISNSSIDINNTPIKVNNTPVDISNSFVHISNSFVHISKSPVDISKSSIDINNTPIKVNNTPVDISNSFVHISKSPVDISKSSIDINNTPIKVNNTPVDISNSFVHISKSPVDISKSSIDINNTPVDISNSFADISNSKITINNDPDLIILNLEINSTEFVNGSTMAAMQNVIKYISNQTIPQAQLGKEIGYSATNQTTLTLDSRKILYSLNKNLSKNLHDNKYIYYHLSRRFGETNEEQEWLYNTIRNNLENNCPVIIGIHGYLEENYGHNIINHTVVINGVEKEDKIENYSYYISDSSYIRRDYLKINGENLSQLFHNGGELIFAAPNLYLVQKNINK